MKASSFLLHGFTGLSYILRKAVLRECLPLVGGIVLNERCNLHCRHCAVSNRSIPDMSFSEILVGLGKLRGMGIKTLFIEGGEPFLWQDGEKRVEDVVERAKAAGFGSVIVYTNGTFPIETNADTVFVSLDGLRDTNNYLRGNCYDAVIANIIASSHPRILINYTINRINEPEIEQFCEEVSKIDRIKGIFFYFYTPYQGADDLYLSHDKKVDVIDRILRLKACGRRILNSYAALRGVRNDAWERPTALCCLYAENKIYPCCRAIGSDEICRECGYLGYAELYYIAKLRPSAIISAAKCL